MTSVGTRQEHLLATAKTLIAENRRRLTATHSLIARSRRLLNTAWGLSGGSDGGDLRLRVRERLGRGTLLPAPERMDWAWAGSGNRCVVCRQAISFEEVEGQVVLRGNGVSLGFSVHGPCFAIWQEESVTWGAGRMMKETQQGRLPREWCHPEAEKAELGRCGVVTTSADGKRHRCQKRSRHSDSLHVCWCWQKWNAGD